MNKKRIKEILSTLRSRRQKLILSIIREYEKFGGKAENCPVDWWNKNPQYPELYRLELQIDRYEGRA